MDDMQRVVLELLRTEEIRFAELIDASEGLEAIFLDEGRLTEEKRQRVTTAKRELKRVQAEAHTVKMGGDTLFGHSLLPRSGARASAKARRLPRRAATRRQQRTG